MSTIHETGKTCRCGDLYSWSSVECECGDLLVDQRSKRGCNDCRAGARCARCMDLISGGPKEAA